MEPVLDVVEPDGATTAVALVLHGGRVKGTAPVRRTHLAVVRMAPFAAALRTRGLHYGLAVARLRYLVRGWNGRRQSPVPDVRWALDRLAARFPGAGIALVGHSMGGRAAIYTAGQDAVRVVVGLAPWLEPDDPYEQLAGRYVLVAHGARDRITSPANSAAWTRRAATVAASASYLGIRRERHAMLLRAGLWHAVTADYVLATLCGLQSRTGPVSEILAGRASLVV